MNKGITLIVCAWVLIGWDAVGHWHKLTGYGISTGYGAYGSFEYELFWSLFWLFVLALLTTGLYCLITKK